MFSLFFAQLLMLSPENFLRGRSLNSCSLSFYLSNGPIINVISDRCVIDAGRFGEEYATLKARILRTLCDATSPDKSLTTQYGGIVAISLFGSKAIDAFLLPVVPTYFQRWEALAATTTDMDQQVELLMCKQAVLNTLGIFLRHVSNVEQTSRISWEELEETFGDRLVACVGEETEYASCVV